MFYCLLAFTVSSDESAITPIIIPWYILFLFRWLLLRVALPPPPPIFNSLIMMCVGMGFLYLSCLWFIGFLGLCACVLYQFWKIFSRYLFIYFCPISFLLFSLSCQLFGLLGRFLCFPLPPWVFVFLFFTSCFCCISMPHTQNTLERFISCFLFLSHTIRGQLPWTWYRPNCFMRFSLSFRALPLNFCTHWRPMGKSWRVGLVTGPPPNCNLLFEFTCSH